MSISVMLTMLQFCVIITGIITLTKITLPEAKTFDFFIGIIRNYYVVIGEVTNWLLS